MSNMADLINQYYDTLDEYHRVMLRLQAAKRRVLRRCGPGRYSTCTVYKVSETRVKAHTRVGYTAVRWKRN